MQQLARAVVRLVPVFLAAQPALAQLDVGGSAPAPEYVPLDASEYMYYSGSTPANFKRTVCGRLTGDAEIDTVTLTNNTLVMLENVVFYGHLVTLPMSANDVEIVPNAVSSSLDGLAVCTANGIEVWGHDENAAAPFFAKLYELNGIWAGATAVRCRSDVDGGTWFAGIRAGELNVAARSPAGVEWSLSLGSQVKEIAWCNWDLTTAEPELAVLQSDRVTVYAPSASFAVKFQWTLGTASAMTVAPAGTDPADRDVVAVLHAIAGTKQLLYAHSLSSTPITIDLPTTVSYKAITSGDATGDGRTDLFVQVGRWYAPLYFEHTISAVLPFVPPTDGAWAPLHIDDDPILTGSIAGNSVASPCIADMNLDGRADIVIAMNQSMGVLDQAPMFYLLRSSLTPTTGEYFIDSSPLNYILQSFVSDVTTATERKLIVRFVAAGTEPPPGNALEVSVWRQTALGVDIDTPPVYRAVHLIDPQTTTGGPDFTTGIVCTIDEAELCGEGAPIYWTMVLPVSCTPPSPHTSPQTVTYTQRYTPKFAAMVSTCSDYLALVAQSDKCHSLVLIPPPAEMSFLNPATVCVDLSPISCPAPTNGSTPAPAYVGRRRAPTFGPNAQLNSTGQPHYVAAPGTTLAY